MEPGKGSCPINDGSARKTKCSFPVLYYWAGQKSVTVLLLPEVLSVSFIVAVDSGCVCGFLSNLMMDSHIRRRPLYKLHKLLLPEPQGLVSNGGSPISTRGMQFEVESWSHAGESLSVREETESAKAHCPLGCPGNSEPCHCREKARCVVLALLTPRGGGPRGAALLSC